MHICGRLACNSVPLISCFIWNFCQENINVLPSSLDSPLLSLLVLSLLSFLFLPSSLSSSEESLELPLSFSSFFFLFFPFVGFLSLSASPELEDDDDDDDDVLDFFGFGDFCDFPDFVDAFELRPLARESLLDDLLLLYTMRKENQYSLQASLQNSVQTNCYYSLLR